MSGAFARFKDAAEHADDGRFPGTIWPKKTEDGTFGDRECHMVNGGEGAVAFGHAFQDERRLHHVSMNADLLTVCCGEG